MAPSGTRWRDKRGGPKPPRGLPISEATRSGLGRGGRAGRTLLVLALALAMLATGGSAWLWLGSLREPPRKAEAVDFVGSESCAGCHRAEADLWASSQHRAAMGHASEKSVRGDFNDASFDYFGVRSRFFRKDGKFFVETDGPDGKLASFEIKYTFGVDPLQQYLIEFPDGRLQALPIAWDTRPKEQGGQRWFHLYPNEEIRHDDLLHWTGLNQTWNFMCAGCHSTGVRKSYDAANDRYATTWTEISVGCEACHGQGSRHLAWARARQSWWPFDKDDDPTMGLLARFDERQGITWPTDPRSGEPHRSIAPALLRKEVETCGRCHARSSQISGEWVPGRWLSDTHIVSPLTEQTYWADGQMRNGEESYNYLPFKQSRMFAEGVTCSDCHDPHGGKLRVAGAGVCLQCHAAASYAGVGHSHHAAAAGQPDCIACHMPVRTYMVNDRRHDHSMRIPRPDLSVKLGIPNACNDCHADRSAEWTAAAVERWFGADRKGFQTYAEAFQAAWSDGADAAQRLAAVAADAHAPAVARAGALSALASRVSPANVELARRGLDDRDPMVRIGAMDMLAGLPPDQVWPAVAPLLSDPVRSVRTRAALLLAAVPTERQPQADRARFESAAAEFIAAAGHNADRPEDRARLANFFARRGLTADAETEYKAALRLSPHYAPGAINLADLYRRLHRDGDGEAVLRAAIEKSPQDGGLHHALGLTLTRMKRPDDALAELRRATELDPNSARYAYVFAVALHSSGRGDEAMAVLKNVLVAHPDDRDILLAMVGFAREAGDVPTALDYARRLAHVMPGDRELDALVRNLEQVSGKAVAPTAP